MFFFIQSDECQRKEVLDTFAMCGRAVRWVLVAVICAPGGVDLVKGTLQEKGVLRRLRLKRSMLTPHYCPKM